MPKNRASPRNARKTPKNIPQTTPPEAHNKEMPSKHKALPTSRRKAVLRSSGKRNSDVSSTQQDSNDTESSEYETTIAATEQCQIDDDAKATTSPLSSSIDTSYQPVGQQLLEQLDKGKRKKKGIKKASTQFKVCPNCGTEAQTSRTKKCQVCSHLFFPKKSSIEPCSHCNEVPRSSRGGRSSHCPNCQKSLLTEDEEEDSLTLNPSSSSPPPTTTTLTEQDVDHASSQNTGATVAPVLSCQEEIDRQQDTPTALDDSTPSFLVGYGSSALAAKSSPDRSESNSGSSNSELKRLLKRKVLMSSCDDSAPQESLQPPTAKRLCTDESQDKSTSTSPPPNSLPPPPLQPSSHSEVGMVSSPLLEYAQKISARVMIPPEISPQVPRRNVKQVKRGGGKMGGNGGHQGTSKSLKNHKGKRLEQLAVKQDEQQLPVLIPDSSPPSPSPSSLAPPPLLSSSAVPPNLIEDTPSRHSAPPIFSPPSEGDGVGYSLSSRASSLTPDSLVVSVATKPHDPTINSIRSLSHHTLPHSLVCISYPSSTSSLTPPTYTQPSLPPLVPSLDTRLLPSNRHTDVYPAQPTNSVSAFFTNNSVPAPPPLVSVCDVTPPKWVTHRPVIVNPVRSKETKEPSAEITEPIAMETSTPPIVQDVASNIAIEDSTMTAEKERCVQTNEVLIEEDIKEPLTVETGNELNAATAEERIKKHKRKQKLELVAQGGVVDEEEAKQLAKKKKKKKKKDREKERGEKGHHSKHRDHSEKKLKKKKKTKKKERELESASQTEDDELCNDQSSNKLDDDTDDHHHNETKLYSVKIVDATVHQIKWGVYRMTLLVPKRSLPTPLPPQREITPIDKPIPSGDSKQEGEDESVTPRTRMLRSGRKRVRETEDREEQQEENEESTKYKKARKGKTKAATEPVEEEKEDQENPDKLNDSEDDLSTIAPSFSVFELRNKLFLNYPPRTVHAFTYKLKVKTRRPPLHWIHVLRHMGGLPESCHTCRLLDAEVVKQLCDFHKIEIPPTLDSLLNNCFGRDRHVYDLTNEDTVSIISNPDLLAIKLPKCYFNDPRCYIKTHHIPLSLEDTSSQQSMASCEDERENKPQETSLITQLSYPPPPPVPTLASAFSSGETHQKPTTAATATSGGGGGSGKKKPCPHCGVSVLCKAKKCRNCGKLFGVFTFGRRVCPMCNHINLARMNACFRCSHPLDKAPSAKPKDVVDSKEQLPSSSKDVSSSKLDFKFGVKKRRRIHHGNMTPPPRATTSKQQQAGFTASDHNDVTDDIFNEEPDSPLVSSERRKGKQDDHNLGYRYGKIPWSDADLALVITSKGIPKFCLQETCNKVLRYHNKTDVFEMVKNLHLPLEQGNTNLLKKLQALGLHPNRSPMCKLISAEDLFALMDAMEEHVPEEVHQHLETISSHSTPMSPTSPATVVTQSTTTCTTPPLLLSSSVSCHSAVPLVGGRVEDVENEFESTLHDIRCSDGQSLSMLRTWKGDHFLCLLEVWRRYFPEVNRSHLSSVIKKLLVETHIPTSQQTNLLRAANVISMRGAPGRLIRLQDVQRMLDDFGIPIQVGDGVSSSKLVVSKQAHPLYQVPRRSMLAMGMSQEIAREKAQMKELADCMKNLVELVDSADIMALVNDSHAKIHEESSKADVEIDALSNELDLLQHTLLDGRDLCHTLSDEIGFLTVTHHTQMAEIVRLSRLSVQSLHEVDLLLDYSQLLSLTESH